MIHTRHTDRAFTLIEVLVSVSIFAIVMLVSTGAVFTIVEANKKTHSLKSVMTNLNFALESMTRDIRVGSTYFCDGSQTDCGRPGETPGSVFHYTNNKGDDVEYSLVGEHIMKRTFSPDQTLSMTADEIHITSMNFYMSGAAARDGLQPKVVISIRGYAGVDEIKSSFNIQTTVTQRSIDS